MTDSFKKLAKRREELIAEATVQREQLASSAKSFSFLALLGVEPEKGGILGHARKHPLIWLSGLMGLITTAQRHRRLASVVSVAALAWSTWRRVIIPFMPFLKKAVRRER